MNLNPKFYNKANCILCGGLFFKRKKLVKGRKGTVNVRSINSVTCSKICSSEYHRSYTSKKRWIPISKGLNSLYT